MKSKQDINLSLSEIPILETSFFPEWYERRNDPSLLKTVPSGIKAIRIGEDHKHGDCEELSKRFKSVITRVLNSLEKPGYPILCWVYGPIGPRGLTYVFPYLGEDYFPEAVDPNKCKERYFFPQILKDHRAGYLVGTIAVEFKEHWLSAVMKDEKIDWDGEMGLLGISVAEKNFVEFMKREELTRDGFFETLQKVEFAFTTSSHFESLYVVGREEKIDQILKVKDW